MGVSGYCRRESFIRDEASGRLPMIQGRDIYLHVPATLIELSRLKQEAMRIGVEYPGRVEGVKWEK